MEEKTKYRVREARPEDMDRVLALRAMLQRHVEASNPGIWRITPSERHREQLTAWMADNDSRVLVATDPADRVIGVIVGHVECREDRTPKITGYLMVACVEPDCRRESVGRMLVQALCAFFVEREVEDVHLSYVIGNREAEAFWTGLGFVPRIVRAGVRRRDLEARLKVRPA